MFVACAWSGLLFAEKTPNVGRLFFLNEFCYDSVHSQKNGERVCNHNSTEAVQKEQKTYELISLVIHQILWLSSLLLGNILTPLSIEICPL